MGGHNGHEEAEGLATVRVMVPVAAGDPTDVARLASGDRPRLWWTYTSCTSTEAKP